MPRRQEGIEGWPLGLRPLMNSRLVFGFSGGSTSFNTLLTASPNSSTLCSSDLDSQSTRSFFKDKSKTLGSLMGVSSTEIVVVSRDTEMRVNAKVKPKPWLFSLCSDLTTTDSVVITATNNIRATNTPSLSHFLEAERTRVSTRRQSCNPLLLNVSYENASNTAKKTNTHAIGLPSRFPRLCSGQLIKWY